MQLCNVDLLQGFQLFQSSSFQVKIVNHHEVHVTFQDIKHQL